MPLPQYYLNQIAQRLETLNTAGALANLNECIDTETHTLAVSGDFGGGGGGGEVTVSNFPSTQAISNTTLTNLDPCIDTDNAVLNTAVSNFPATQPISNASLTSLADVIKPHIIGKSGEEQALNLCFNYNPEALAPNNLGVLAHYFTTYDRKSLASCDYKGRLITTSITEHCTRKKIDSRITGIGINAHCGRSTLGNLDGENFRVPAGRIGSILPQYFTGIGYNMYVFTLDATATTQTLTITYFTGVAADDYDPNTGKTPTTSTYSLNGTTHVPLDDMVYIVSAKLSAVCEDDVYIRNSDDQTAAVIPKGEINLIQLSISVPTLGSVLLDKLEIVSWGPYANAGRWVILHKYTDDVTEKTEIIADGVVANNGYFSHDLSHIPPILGLGSSGLGGINCIYPAYTDASGYDPTVYFNLHAISYLGSDFTDDTTAISGSMFYKDL